MLAEQVTQSLKVPDQVSESFRDRAQALPMSCLGFRGCFEEGVQALTALAC